MDRIRRQLMMPDSGPTGKGVRIAVLDTGIDVEHADFGNTDQNDSDNFTWLSTDIVDRCYHGTHVAGIIGGNGSTSRGLYRGLAPDAELVIMKTSVRGVGLEGDVAAALEASIAAPVD